MLVCHSILQLSTASVLTSTTLSWLQYFDQPHHHDQSITNGLFQLCFASLAGAGPVGLAAAASAQLLGASAVIVGDLNKERLAQARDMGCETVDVSEPQSVKDQVASILGVPEVDCGVDCVGFEARGCGHSHHQEVPAQVLNDLMTITRAGQFDDTACSLADNETANWVVTL